MTRLRIVILTGQSGSGKSTALHALEDQGNYCVDNLPTNLVEQLIEVIRKDGNSDKIAVVMDIREHFFVERAPALIARLKKSADQISVVFLEARRDVLIRRYSETRRMHPLDQGTGLTFGIDNFDDSRHVQAHSFFGFPAGNCTCPRIKRLNHVLVIEKYDAVFDSINYNARFHFFVMERGC